MPGNGNVTFHFGFSDELSLQVDDRVVYSGQHTWKDTSEWSERGYASTDQHVSCDLSRGVHTVTAVLKATEYFGFGMALRIEGAPHSLLPAELYG